MTSVCKLKHQEQERSKTQELNAPQKCDYSQTCNKHQCSQKNVSCSCKVKNSELYKEQKCCVRKVCKCKCGYQLNQSHYEPGIMKSIYRVDYEKKKSQQENYQAKYAYQQNNAQFYDETTYNKSYVPQKIDVHQPHCHAEYRPNSAKFNASTTYRAQYTGKQGEQACGKQRFAYQQNDLPFYSHTTYGDEYKKHKVDVQKPNGGCHAEYRPNTAKFNASTTYRAQYTGKSGQQAYGKEKFAYQQNNLPFYGHTTYGDEFKKHNVDVEKSHGCCHAEYRPNTAKFNASTTYKAQYTGKQGEQIQGKQKFAYQQNDLPFYDHTTYGDEYKRYKIDNQQSLGCCYAQCAAINDRCCCMEEVITCCNKCCTCNCQQNVIYCANGSNCK